MLLSPSTVCIPPHADPPYDILRSHPVLNLISTCSSIDHLKQVHALTIKSGLHHTQFALSKLVEFCSVSPHGDLSYGLRIFNAIQEPNLLIWNTVLRGFSLCDESKAGIGFYVNMLECGVVPNFYTFPFVLKCCSKVGCCDEGEQVHAQVVKQGLVSDPFVHTSLINMYAKSGELETARWIFDRSGRRDAISFTVLISGYAQRGDAGLARELFEEMHVRDVVSWNAMIAGHVECGQFDDSLNLFREMMAMNLSPTESTIVSVLSACAQSANVQLGKWIHSEFVAGKHEMETSPKVVNAMIDMYAKCGDPKMARGLFDSTVQKDVISWNVMIGGYTHANQSRKALELFREMLKLGIEPNDVTLLNVLPSCGSLGALDLVKWIHVFIDKNSGDLRNPSLFTSLIDAYTKCGNLKTAEQIFSGLKHRSLSSWNAMISGLAIHGKASKAIELFSKMVSEGLKPDDVTFVGLLSACNHAGLLELGGQYFCSMTRDYGIIPKLEHYGCMIDLLGKNGMLDEAKALISTMDIQPDAAIWGSLLDACRTHGMLELGELVAKRLIEVEPENEGAYVLLSNMYAKARRWDDVARLRGFLKDRGMKKVPGCTSIEVDGVVREFIVGDRTHPGNSRMYDTLRELDRCPEMSKYRQLL
ncbi:hypothetical protein MLD38_006633 [Melastoma candidum]|uniref:Uncharacterized protein n=1 Tax=Melastoma candidum TaxID=119954 RepID=A0ACB9RN80_9MYRT|nr:hypothetical protein MLD38_006633 [Melastoma candidum]